MLEVKNLNKKFNNFELKDVSFKLEDGSIMGFIGSNGAGKSTTIRSILELSKRDSGEVIYFGDKKLDRKVKEEIGIVFEECYYFAMMNGYGINKMCKGIYSNWDEDTFYRYLKEFGLKDKQDIKEFSKGMTMKMSIAVALSHNPRLLILDEALNGLDLNTRMSLIDLFGDFVKDGKKSILISSHIISDLEKLCDTITYIDDGKVLFSDNKEELLSRYACIKCHRDDLDKYKGYQNYSIRNDSYVLVPSNKFEESRPATIEDIILISNGKLTKY